MVDLLRMFLAQAGEHVTLLLACMLLFAALDAALGIGAVLPGETGIVLAAVTLSDRAELLAAGVFVAALGAFLGDHVGFAVGRGLGARLGDTRLIKRLGRDRWEKARYYVAGRFWIVILARALLQRLAAVRGRLSLCADQAAAAKWWLSMPMASVSAEGPMPKALSTRRTSPLMPGCRHQGRACPLRRARMTSNPLIVA